MRPIGTHNYFVYITTNKRKSVLYTGITNDLSRRLSEHEEDAKTTKKHFAGKYNAYYLVYWERYEFVHHAIEREKQIKRWSRKKKEWLIATINPKWHFLNNMLD